MKWIYGALINGRLSAFHKKESVINSYLENYKNSNPTDKVSLVKIKKKKALDLENYVEFYLVECEGVYIQCMYQDVFQMQKQESIYKRLEEELTKLLALNLKKKERRSLLESIKILEKKKSEQVLYTPSLKVLEEAYWMYEEYKNKVY